jgi:hypothetical protein
MRELRVSRDSRARVARDLHDVVTHHVTAMVVQADAAQFLLDGTPEQVGKGNCEDLRIRRESGGWASVILSGRRCINRSVDRRFSG